MTHSTSKASSITWLCEWRVRQKKGKLHRNVACVCRLRPRASLPVPGPLTRCDVAVADGLHLPYRTGALLHLYACPAPAHATSQSFTPAVACTLDTLDINMGPCQPVIL